MRACRSVSLCSSALALPRASFPTHGLSCRLFSFAAGRSPTTRHQPRPIRRLPPTRHRHHPLPPGPLHPFPSPQVRIRPSPVASCGACGVAAAQRRPRRLATLPPTRPRRRSVPLRPCRRGLSRSDCPSRRLRARSVCAVRHPSHWTLPSSSPDSFARASAARAEYDLPPLRDSPEAASWQPERLALLPCGHAFHTECLGDWLALSGRVRAPSLSRLLSLWASSTGLLTHALMVDDRRTVPALSARPSCTEEAPHAAKRRGSAIRQRRRGEWRSRDGRARVKKQEGLRLYYCSRRCAACL